VAAAFFRNVPSQFVADLEIEPERLAAGASLLDADAPSGTVRILLEGWAVRSKTLRDGRRQIIGLMFAGDACSFWTPIFGPWDHEVHTLTTCRSLRTSAEQLLEMAQLSPAFAAMLAERTAVDAAIVHTWLVNLGQRKAPERLAHLFCELRHRLGVRGGGSATIPLTQQDLADALGMTSVHVNRVLQRLRAEGLVDLRKGAVVVLDASGLARQCDFDPSYLASREMALRS
jgi:CRP-like cAMP-binding protein